MTDIANPGVRRTKVLTLLLLLAGLLIAFGALGAQNASAGSGGMGPGGTSPSGPTASGTKGGKVEEGNHLQPSKYTRLWGKVPPKEKRWASQVAECETGKDPNMTALDGEYRGAFMFLQESWDNAPKTPGGDPIDYTYKVQAVVAVALKKQMGTGPWPVCG